MLNRIQEYQRNLRLFQTLQSVISNPRFNADQDKRTFDAFNALSDWLKNEADALWKLGINVYH